MFTFLLDLITEKGKGIHAYVAVSKAAFDRALTEPDHAAAFYFLATSAESFVELHERQPLSSDELEQNFKTFQADIQQLEDASTGSAENRLSVLNQIVKARIEYTR
ncbi:hypothetical protein ERN12_15360 [Rhodobacteraceae bacterium]|nr:hypothetical protein ERN12_15360 [Paracoccaceae bacterium]